MTYKKTEHDLSQYLPWYVNGTLDDDTAELIDAALVHDEVLQHQLELVLEDQTSTINLAETETVPEHMDERFRVAFDQHLMSADKISAPRAANSGFSLSEFIQALFPSRGYAFAALAALLVIAGQAVVIINSNSSTKYQTATGEQEVAKTLRFLVQIAPDATIEDLSAYLTENNGNIKQGPTADGLFEVEFNETNTAKSSQIEQDLTAKNPLFIMALPSSN